MKNSGPSCLRYSFVFYPEYWLWFVCPLRTLPNNFSSHFFADEEKGATSVLGPQPIIWLLPSSPPWSGDFVRATRCHPSQVTVNSNSSHPTSIVSVGYHVTIYIYFKYIIKKNSCFATYSYLITFCSFSMQPCFGLVQGISCIY